MCVCGGGGGGGAGRAIKREPAAAGLYISDFAPRKFQGCACVCARLRVCVQGSGIVCCFYGFCAAVQLWTSMKHGLGLHLRLLLLGLGSKLDQGLAIALVLGSSKFWFDYLGS